MISLFPHFDGKWLLTASHLWDKWHYQLLIWYFFEGQSAFHHLWQKWSIFSRLSSLPIPLYWHPMTAATYFGVFNCLKFNYSTQETLFSETSVVIWLKRSTSRFLENHTVPVRYICAKQTNISFFSFQFRNNPLLHAVFTILLSSHAYDMMLPTIPIDSSLCSSLLIFTVLSSKAPKTMKYCADLIETSLHNVKSLRLMSFQFLNSLFEKWQ